MAERVAVVRGAAGLVLLGVFGFAPFGSLHGWSPAPWVTASGACRLAVEMVLGQDLVALAGMVVSGGTPPVQHENALWHLALPRLCILASLLAVAAGVFAIVSPSGRRARLRLASALVALGALPTLVVFV